MHRLYLIVSLLILALLAGAGANGGSTQAETDTIAQFAFKGRLVGFFFQEVRDGEHVRLVVQFVVEEPIALFRPESSHLVKVCTPVLIDLTSLASDDLRTWTEDELPVGMRMGESYLVAMYRGEFPSAQYQLVEFRPCSPEEERQFRDDHQNAVFYVQRMRDIVDVSAAYTIFDSSSRNHAMLLNNLAMAETLETESGIAELERSREELRGACERAISVVVEVRDRYQLRAERTTDAFIREHAEAAVQMCERRLENMCRICAEEAGMTDFEY